jgi:hypothetical protein
VTTRPTIGVEIAFGTPFTAISSTTWTDVSTRVLLDPAMGGGPITISRGRQSELGRIEAGKLSLTLDNRTRAFDSEYTSGPYYPNIKPLKRIRVYAIWASTAYVLFTGYIEAWEPVYPGGRLAVVRVRAGDAMSVIARATVSYSGDEFINWAILSILTLIGWPGADWVYDGAQSQVPFGSYLNVNPLMFIQQLVEAENGLFFIQGDGKGRFQDRHWRIRNSTSNATFGTATGELPYESVDQSFDDQLIYNDVQITRAGGALQQAIDATSQAAYGPRLLPRTGILLGTDAEALGLAQWLLLRYKDPALRIPRMTLSGDMAPSALWPQLLGRDLSDKITVRVRPPPSGSSLIEKSARIEAISHTIGADSWRVGWDLSMAGDDLYWTIGDAVKGQIDSVYKIAY